jgi:histidyl-tRNA synthetase
VLRSFGFSEMRTPVLERTELFARSIGETTDIVEKEMYTFSDLSGDSLTMRPEATAGVIRAYLEHKLYSVPGPHKIFSIGPMFRHERPQKGRLRQFHQIDVEVLDDEGPMVDAELMVMLDRLLKELGLSEVALVINSLGCPQCRPAYRRALIDFLAAKTDQLCPDCQRRLQLNPLRVLDCKVEGCKEAAAGAPVVSDHLCQGCRDHFEELKDLIGSAGVVFREDSRLVRGLDYYTRTTFEAKAGALGAQDAVAGGGRYDGLVEQLGGPPRSCIGFAMGCERLALLLGEGQEPDTPEIFMAAMGLESRRRMFPLVAELRSSGLWVEMSSQDKSLKAQMRRANKLGADVVIIVGEQELAEGSAIIKRLEDGSQQAIQLQDLSRVAQLLVQSLKNG